jgi:hypothetical protein
VCGGNRSSTTGGWVCSGSDGGVEVRAETRPEVGGAPDTREVGQAGEAGSSCGGDTGPGWTCHRGSPGSACEDVGRPPVCGSDGKWSCPFGTSPSYYCTCIGHDCVTDGGSAGSGYHYWSILCTAAEACGWLKNDHPELGSSYTECMSRHSAARPSSELPYLSGFERCTVLAAEPLDCRKLTECYTRPDLDALMCSQAKRCGLTSTCDAFMSSNDETKFDYACPAYCMESLANNAACTQVKACASACQ